MQSWTSRAAAVLFALLWTLLQPPSVGAQPLGKTAVATVTGRDEQPALELAAAVEEQLASRRVPIIALHEVLERFTAASRPPRAPTPSDLELLAKEARRSVEHVAFGRSAAAEQSVREIVTLAERSLESLNRETRNARQLLDACLVLVRSSLHEGQRERAIEQAMGCRRLVPDLTPKETAQPANVIGVLAEADDELRRMRIGSLKVAAVPSRACAVYLNGRHLGATPFAMDRAAVGTYRVQVECDEKTPGRVHIVNLGDQSVELRVDLEFDRSVVTDPRLGLSYTESNELRRSLLAHGVQLGREVRAEEVIFVRQHAGTFEVARVNVDGQRVTAAVQAPLDSAGRASKQALFDALDALAQGRFTGVSPEAYAPLKSAKPNLNVSTQDTPQPSPPTDRSSDRPIQPAYKKWWLWTMIGLVVAGGVATGVVLGLRTHGDKPSSDPTIDIPNH